MSRFLAPLRVEPIGKRGWGPFKRTVWRLLAPLDYASDLLGTVIAVPQGYVSDFASVPRFLPISWYLAGDTGQWAAVVHDYLCEQRKDIPQGVIDAVYHEALGVNEFATPEPSWRQWAMWAGVRAWQITKALAGKNSHAKG